MAKSSGRSPAKQAARRLGHRAEVRTNDTGFRWGLADGLGFTVLIVLTFAWWGGGDPSAVSAMMLTAGALACLPFGIARWRAAPRPDAISLVPVLAAVVLLAWGFISAIGSGAPWQVSVYGWFDRSDGLLTLLAVVALLISAASLKRHEIDRVITWLLAAGAIVVLEGMAQLAGLPYPPRLDYEGLAGPFFNPNFFAATTAMLALLTLGRVLAQHRPAWQRWSALALLLGLLASTVLSTSDQGPVSFVIGLVAGGIAWSLQHRGRGRGIALTLSLVAVVSGVVGFILVVLQAGPFAGARQATTVGLRESYWEAAWRMMTGLPVFGSGPDGLERYVTAFRTETYLQSPGSKIAVSAAHDIPLQYGATFGVIGLLAWLVVMIGTGVVLLRALLRGIDHIWVGVSLTGAWVAYLAQAVISIDAPGLKALGWLLTGLVVAFAINREGGPPRALAWPPWVAGGLGVLAVVIWWSSLASTFAATSAASVEEAKAAVVNATVPCPVRQRILGELVQTIPLQQLAVISQEALDVDPRCVPMAPLVSEIALRAGDLEAAQRAADIAVETDPLDPVSWYVRSLVLRESGDEVGANQAFAEARRLAAIDPTDALDEELAQDPSADTSSP